MQTPTIAPLTNPDSPDRPVWSFSYNNVTFHEVTALTRSRETVLAPDGSKPRYLRDTIRVQGTVAATNAHCFPATVQPGAIIKLRDVQFQGLQAKLLAPGKAVRLLKDGGVDLLFEPLIGLVRDAENGPTVSNLEISRGEQEEHFTVTMIVTLCLPVMQVPRVAAEAN